MEVLFLKWRLKVFEKGFFSVEVLFLKWRLKVFKKGRVKKIMVEGDSKLVFQVVMGRYSTSSNLVHIIEYIKWVATQFIWIDWKRIFKEVNFVADVFARQGLFISDCHIGTIVFLHLHYLLLNLIMWGTVVSVVFLFNVMLLLLQEKKKTNNISINRRIGTNPKT